MVGPESRLVASKRNRLGSCDCGSKTELICAATLDRGQPKPTIAAASARSAAIALRATFFCVARSASTGARTCR